jgi:hypothetical protein
MSRVVKDMSALMAPLDESVAGRESKDRVTWTEDLSAAFRRAQHALSSNKYITLPQPEDALWIVTYVALRKRGFGATLYVSRNNKVLIVGFFSARLRSGQALWLPC